MGRADCATSDRPSTWLMIGHSICSRLIIKNTTSYKVILVRTLSFPLDLPIVRL